MANTDDVSMPANTLRAWIIGFIWSIILPGINQFLLFRFPSITVTGVGQNLPLFVSSTPISHPGVGDRAASVLSNRQTLGVVHA